MPIRRENLDYGKVGTGKSGLGKIKSELNEVNSRSKYIAYRALISSKHSQRIVS